MLNDDFLGKFLRCAVVVRQNLTMPQWAENLIFCTKNVVQAKKNNIFYEANMKNKGNPNDSS